MFGDGPLTVALYAENGSLVHATGANQAAAGGQYRGGRSGESGRGKPGVDVCFEERTDQSVIVILFRIFGSCSPCHDIAEVYLVGGLGEMLVDVDFSLFLTHSLINE